jgi:hypothetical protein
MVCVEQLAMKCACPVSVAALKSRALCSPAVGDEGSLSFWDVAL